MAARSAWFHQDGSAMSIRRRFIAVPVVLGLFALAGVLLLQQSGAQAGAHLSYSKLNKIQRRLISSSLASALMPKRSKTGARAAGIGPDDGPGADGLPDGTPASFPKSGSSPSSINYFPAGSGKCDSNLGGNVKVNQNCLNVSDPGLQGRGQ